MMHAAPQLVMSRMTARALIRPAARRIFRQDAWRRLMATLPAAGAPLADMQAYLEAQIAANSDKMGITTLNTEDGKLTKEQWYTLCQLCSPGMHKATMNSLFITMDLNKTNFVNKSEIYSDTILGILQTRFNYTSSVHPLEGAYMCLPSPPFQKDEAQTKCIKKLIEVWDKVVADWEKNGTKALPLKMVPDPKIMFTSLSEGGSSMFEGSSLFESLTGKLYSSKGKAAPTPPKPPMKAEPQAAKGLYLYGGSGCGKTILLDIFYRSLPEGFPVVRVHWHEFQRDVFRLTGRAKKAPGENLYDSAAVEIAGSAKVLLLDELWITHINEALNVKEICRALWARGVTTIFTSNYQQKELYKDGFNYAAFEDFIPEMAAQCPEFDFTSLYKTDYRLTDVDDVKDHYLFPINAETTAKMVKMQQQLLGPNGKVDKEFVYEIPGEGRTKVLPVSGQCSDGTQLCQVDFGELFSKPLGRAIYSALAIEYEHIFITGAPKFKLEDQSAEFRRFVTFTDLVYGKKGQLYIQGEVEAMDLFESPKAQEGEASGSVEDDYRAWVRMMSMLGEMRTNKYKYVSWLARNHMTRPNASKLVL